jgi:hypothetical protein
MVISAFRNRVKEELQKLSLDIAKTLAGSRPR